MKKVLLVLALVAAYGVSMAMSNATTISIDETVVVVADADEKVVKEEGKKAAKAETTKTEAKAETTKAKGEGCSGTAAKSADAKKGSGCSSSCGGAKK